ncbi:MAG: HAD family hydrolase [Coriobacteriaceae bacterium]|nr:HAD family hydrolase [Coriobacteriaceae bacterium]
MSGTKNASNSRWKYIFALFAVFVLGAVLAVLLTNMFLANKYAPKQPASAPVASEAATASSAAESSTAESASSSASTSAATAPAAVDIATTFPSWNPESKSLSELVAYVQEVCDPASTEYLEPKDRIATFDMDGTIISEKAPFYIDYMLLIHRVLDDPDHKADAQMTAIIEQVRDNAYQGMKDSNLSPARHQALDEEFAGMTPDELHAYVNTFMDTVQTKGFDGMTYGESFYQPMLEVIDYLEANEFQVYIVSAGEREIVRAVVERLGIEPNRVIGADIAYTTANMGSADATDYTMAQDDDVVLSTPSVDDCEKTGKVLAIAREIGKKPTLAFGNSSGDHAMLNYAEANGGMACYVVADDTAREYGDAEKAAESYRLVEDESWTSFSMANDWATIYGQSVTKTELPGPVSQELAPAA